MGRRGWLAVALVGALMRVLAGAPIASGAAWTTYHHDAARSGIGPDCDLATHADPRLAERRA